MKRKGYLYQNIYKFDNIVKAYNEVCKITKNKRKVEYFKEYKCLYISRIHDILKNRAYKVGKYNVFTIFEPKERRIVSQNMQDKVVNHLVARYILYPVLLPCLLDINVASRKNMGTEKGLYYYREFFRKSKIKYKNFYVLKCDISKFFASIDHNILKQKLRNKLKDKEALKIIFDIIDVEENGLSIGAMTSQVLAIFYLNDMDHYIKEVLKIKYYVRYQDDFLLIHPSKEYLKSCLEKIKHFLDNEKLSLNRKTRIYKNTNNFIFLGRTRKCKYAKYREIDRKLKKRMYLYKTGKITLMSLLSSSICFQNLTK